MLLVFTMLLGRLRGPGSPGVEAFNRGPQILGFGSKKSAHKSSRDVPDVKRTCIVRPKKVCFGRPVWLCPLGKLPGKQRELCAGGTVGSFCLSSLSEGFARECRDAILLQVSFQIVASISEPLLIHRSICQEPLTHTQHIGKCQYDVKSAESLQVSRLGASLKKPGFLSQCLRACCFFTKTQPDHLGSGAEFLIRCTVGRSTVLPFHGFEYVPSAGCQNLKGYVSATGIWLMLTCRPHFGNSGCLRSCSFSFDMVPRYCFDT